MRKAALALIATLLSIVPAWASSLEVLGTARANSATQTLTFRIAAHQNRVSEIRLRSGSLTAHFLVIEISFADGGRDRLTLDATVPPGHQTPAVQVDPSRAITEIFVAKRPALMPGETAIQLLGKVERKGQSSGPLPPSR
jgi:hypothetical protein